MAHKCPPSKKGKKSKSSTVNPLDPNDKTIGDKFWSD